MNATPIDLRVEIRLEDGILDCDVVSGSTSGTSSSTPTVANGLISALERCMLVVDRNGPFTCLFPDLCMCLYSKQCHGNGNCYDNILA